MTVRVKCACYFTVLLCLLNTGKVLADTTLNLDASTSSLITQSGSVFEVRGNSIGGGNLFHSFSDLSVGSGDTLSFLNQNTLGNTVNIDNIIARVTGDNLTEIAGTVRSDASLWLVNSNGLLVHETAYFNIKGSLHLGTSESLLFGSADNETALNSQDASTPFFSISDPAGFGFLSTAATYLEIGAPSIVFDMGGDQSSVRLFSGDYDQGAPPQLDIAGRGVEFKNGTFKTDQTNSINIYSVNDEANIYTTAEFSNVISSSSRFNDSLLADFLSGQPSSINGADVTMDNFSFQSEVGESNLGISQLQRIFIYGGDHHYLNQSFLAHYPGAGIDGKYMFLGDRIYGDQFSVGHEFIGTSDSRYGSSSLSFGVYASEEINFNQVELFNGVAWNGTDSALVTNGDITLANTSIVSTVTADFFSDGNAGNEILISGKTGIDILDSSISLSGRHYVQSYEPNLAEKLSIVSDLGDVNLVDTLIDLSSPVADIREYGGGFQALPHAPTFENLDKEVGSLFIEGNNVSISTVDGESNINIARLLSTHIGGELNIHATEGNIEILDTLIDLKVGASDSEIIGLGDSIVTEAIARGLSEGQGLLADEKIQAQLSESGSTIAGSVNMTASGSISIAEISRFSTSTIGSGAAGAIYLSAQGAVNIEENSVIASDSATVNSGSAGSIFIDANGVKINQSKIQTVTRSDVQTNSKATIDINAGGGKLEIIGNGEEGNGLYASTGGDSDAGDISLHNASLVLIDNETIDTSSEREFAPEFEVLEGRAGSITISDIDDLVVRNGARIQARTSRNSINDAGAISISADSMRLSNGAQISTSSNGIGQAGDINITDTNHLEIIKSARNILIEQATGSESDAAILTSSSQSGGGNVTIEVRDYIGIVNSDIVTKATGDGGNISIDPELLFFDGARLDTSAVTGNGGQITVQADQIIRSLDTDFDSRSKAGVDGEVAINGVTNQVGQTDTIKVDYANVSSLLSQKCHVGQLSDRSSFVVNQESSSRQAPDEYRLSALSSGAEVAHDYSYRNLIALRSIGGCLN